MSQIVLPYCYKITHKTTNQFYIGYRCANKLHYSEDLGFKYFTSSKTVKELGFDNFKIDWIEEFPTAELAYEWEQMMIYVNFKDFLCLNKKCHFKNKTYFGLCGKKFSKEHKNKISNSLIGRKLSNEHKEKISNSLKGNFISEETRNKISSKNKGRIKSKEEILKLSISNSGQKRSEEAKLNMSKAKIGKKLSNDHKEKISKANKNRIFSEEHKINLSKAKRREP